MHDQTRGWACGKDGDGGINFETKDGGDTWVYRNDLGMVNMFKIFFLNSESGWGVRGKKIYKYDSGTDVDNDTQEKLSFEIYQNYPNPFNPSTSIQFELPKSGYTTLIIYNQLGQVVNTVMNSELSAGSYRYEFDGAGYSSGFYYYRLTSGDYSKTKKMVLLK